MSPDCSVTLLPGPHLPFIKLGACPGPGFRPIIRRPSAIDCAGSCQADGTPRHHESSAPAAAATNLGRPPSSGSWRDDRRGRRSDMGSGRLLERLRRWSSYPILDGARCGRWRRDWGWHRCHHFPDQTLTEFSSRQSDDAGPVRGVLYCRLTSKWSRRAVRLVPSCRHGARLIWRVRRRGEFGNQTLT